MIQRSERLTTTWQRTCDHGEKSGLNPSLCHFEAQTAPSGPCSKACCTCPKFLLSADSWVPEAPRGSPSHFLQALKGEPRTALEELLGGTRK